MRRRLSFLLDFALDFALAWRLLTVMPLPWIPQDFERPAGPAAAYFPLVGAVLGLFLAGGGWLFSILLPPGVAAALLVTLWAGLTGLLHLDGLMDSCDGLLPPRDPARRLEIMKDSRAGAFGVIGVILLLLIKFNALLALFNGVPPLIFESATGPQGRFLTTGLSFLEAWPGRRQTFLLDPAAALVVIPALARWAMTWQMARYPLARRQGLSAFFKQGLGRGQVIGASVVTMGLSLGGLGGPGLLLLGVTWLIAALTARLALSRLGGLTGDIYGATCEVIETVLVVVVAAWEHHQSLYPGW